MRSWMAVAAASALLAAPPAGKTPERLRVPFWIVGESGAATVQAKLNGDPAKVLRLQGPGDDLVVLLILDLAGDLSLVDPARHSLIESMPKALDRAGIALMSSQDGALKVLADPGTAHEKIGPIIEGLNIAGRAGLLDTVETAAQLGDSILGKAKVRVAVFYVTDSSIGNYREDYTNPVVNSGDARDLSRRFPEGIIKEKFQQLRARIAATQAPLFIVHLDHRNDQLNEAYQTGLLELATVTGGAAEFCRSVADIPATIEKTLATIAAMRSAEIEGAPAKTRQLHVELTAEGGELRYRNSFAAKGK
ncbi:MAG: hypothetical protein U0Q16_16430 [Bryobacteraceae bacterium]